LALVGVVLQQERAPKSIHRWQVLVPIDLSQVIKNRREQFVAIHFLIKRINEELDLRFGRDVLARLLHNSKQHTRGACMLTSRSLLRRLPCAAQLCKNNLFSAL